ncbi:MAG: hypothetical protein PVI23_02355 [Maricaulaceae bacterium]|jgi:hypothetical protein
MSMNKSNRMPRSIRRRIPGARFIAGCLVFAALTGGAGALADAGQLNDTYALDAPPDPYLGAHEFARRVGLQPDAPR